MLGKLEEGKEPVAIRAAIIRSLGNLGDGRARKAILKGIADTDNAVIRVEACRALGKVGLPEDATTLARIMTIDKLEDCRIAAIEAIGATKTREPRIYQMLLDGMDHEDPAIRYQCLQSLRMLTEKDSASSPKTGNASCQRDTSPAATTQEPKNAAAARAKAAAKPRRPGQPGGRPVFPTPPSSPLDSRWLTRHENVR